MDRLKTRNFESVYEFLKWLWFQFYSHYFQPECYMLNQNHQMFFALFTFYLNLKCSMFRGFHKLNNYFVNNSLLWFFFLCFHIKWKNFEWTIHIRSLVTIFPNYLAYLLSFIILDWLSELSFVNDKICSHKIVGLVKLLYCCKRQSGIFFVF